jgi:hypothetical protein
MAKNGEEANGVSEMKKMKIMNGYQSSIEMKIMSSQKAENE